MHTLPFCAGDLSKAQVLVIGHDPRLQESNTHLCNVGLPHAPKGKTVLIPEQEAEAGVNVIRGILNQSSIEVIFAMSEQVNYWLQKLGFYPAVPDFLDKAEPKPRGLSHDPPYYEHRESKAFQLICGQCHTDGSRKVFPVLHAKQWPLRGGLARAYGKAYENCVNQFK
jgi:hypothetical protein